MPQGYLTLPAAADWEDRERYPVRVPLRFKNGRRYADVKYNLRPDGGCMIHRANVRREEAAV